MAKNYYYGSYPFIAWCVNHYFLSSRHSLWVSAPFYAPRSMDVGASPYRIYGELQSLVSSDSQGKDLRDWRDRLRKPVVDDVKDEGLQTRLLEIVERIAIPFFVPLVYRVDIDALPLGLAIQGDSEGRLGLNHYEVRALEETQFDVLFADFEGEDILRLWRSDNNQLTALEILERNC
jgi:hypothetical protein